MRNKHRHLALKIISFVVCFSILFWIAQTILVSTYVNSETVEEFYDLEDNSIDVLFLGPSQMYCGINAEKLTDEYGISSYDFGAGGQPLMISYYYLQEALKRQKPKIVCIEMCRLFDDAVTSQRIAYSYPAMPLTAEKYRSLLTVLDGDKKEALTYISPLMLFAYHSWWNQINPFKVVRNMLVGVNNYSRGYACEDGVEKVSIEYLQEDDGAVRPIPEGSKTAIPMIAELCRENGIKLMFVKVPVASEWTRSDSKTAKRYMEENGYLFIDMNDYIDEIGLNAETDFRNALHLNASGADKTTDFIADRLQELLAQQASLMPSLSLAPAEYRST